MRQLLIDQYLPLDGRSRASIEPRSPAEFGGRGTLNETIEVESMNHDTAIRLAVWSGPRNISTAMMRSWGNRSDTFVCDEPFYSNYLMETKLPHPLANQIIEHHESDWRKVVDWLTGDVPDGKAIFYQKQMTHHLLPHIDREWLAGVTNCFVIREPRDVITSYIKKNDEPNLEDTGFPQQLEIFNWVREHSGITPAVIDARDIQNEPRRMQGLLCDAIGVNFQESMLSWEPGLRETDGIWAEHWYAEVVRSTSFRPYKQKSDQVPNHLSEIHDQCLKAYHQLYEHRLR